MHYVYHTHATLYVYISSMWLLLRVSKGPPEYCQDGTVTHLNYNRLL